MKRKIQTIQTSAFSLALMLASACPSHAQSTNTDFQQAVAEYNQSSGAATMAAREKVIKLAAAMDQLPPIPEQARKHFVMGSALFKEAKTPDDFSQVVDEFGQAFKIAPWWPEAGYNRALALEAAGDYAAAVSQLKLYQLFKLPETETRP